MAQVADAQLTAVIDPESNSIALIVKHLAGNMRTRWTNFLTSDGEKPDRDRDTEFEAPPSNRDELMRMWETGWNCVFSALLPLSEEDLAKTVTIRGEAHSVAQAILRQVGHYASHVGQIIFLAKHLQSANWTSLSIPRGRSEEFNRKTRSSQAGP
jgi:Protein of unknown function (DUF1572)